MHRYVYALVRCVPDPGTGEFINIGAIAGNPETGDWSMRQVGNESRARKLARAHQLEAVHRFLGHVGECIDEAVYLPGTGSCTLDEAWLQKLHHDHRNVVQITAPAPVAAASAEQALDYLFASQIIDPQQVQLRQPLVTKHTIVHSLRAAYRHVLVDPGSILRAPELHVGAHVHAPLDFAVIAKRTVQITSGWSFRIAGTDEQSTDIKAWAFAIDLLRGDEEARVICEDGPAVPIDRDVDVAVVVAEPETPDQVRAYEEATQVFSRVGATVRPVDQADAVATQAAVLLASAA